MTTSETLRFEPDARDSSPIYMQLARKLADLIREGHYKPDEALPSERLLAETLNLSRVTARSAIDQLVSQGLIVRRVAGYGLANCLRITVGDEASCRRVAHAVGQFKAQR